MIRFALFAAAVLPASAGSAAAVESHDDGAQGGMLAPTPAAA